MPPLDSWMKRVLGGLFGLWVIELVARAIGAPVDLLVWFSGATLSTPWALVTRFLVQGPNVLGVLVDLLMIYFLVPPLLERMSRRSLLEALGVAAAAGTVLALVWDLVIGGVGPVYGWSLVVTAIAVAFGLSDPGAVIRLNFILPVKGSWIVWGVLGVLVLFLLSSLGSGGAALWTLEHIGTWAGLYGWWHMRGPGARVRLLHQQKRGVERELRRFEVIEGDRGRHDDEVVH